MKHLNTLFEIAGFIMVSVALWLALSLVGYSPYDYGEDVFPAHVFIQNPMGSTGAEVARTLYFWLGEWGAWTLVLTVFFYGGVMFIQGPVVLSVAGGAGFSLATAMAQAELGVVTWHSTIPTGGQYGIYGVAFLKDHFPGWLRIAVIGAVALVSLSWMVTRLLQEVPEWEEWEEEVAEGEEQEDNDGERESSGRQKIGDETPLIDERKKKFHSKTTVIDAPRLILPTGPFRRMLADYQKQPPGEVILGRNKEGQTETIDLFGSRGVLIAGDEEKEVDSCLHSLLLSLSLKYTPRELQVFVLDPQNRLSTYEEMPHLAVSPLRDANRLVDILEWFEEEAWERKTQLQGDKTAAPGYNMPYMVLVIDELAEAMLTMSKELEKFLTDMAPICREVGMACIFTTGRPSLDVITPTIKEYCQVRVAYQVFSRIDSTIILNHQGAEKLRGKRDALYVKGEEEDVHPLQSVYISPGEIQKVLTFLRQTHCESRAA